MSEKIELKEKLAAVDMNFRTLWDEMDADQRKSLKNEFFILNRYISSVQSSKREVQEHFVLTVNEYFNKNWNILQKHPKLMWMLLCMCSYNGNTVFFHQWLGLSGHPILNTSWIYHQNKVQLIIDQTQENNFKFSSFENSMNVIPNKRLILDIKVPR